MASITDQVIKLQELTQQNLDILQAINDSFFTKKNHLYASVGDNKYAIPSFISLENKINLLAANFENLISAPKTGEAFFNMDGNSRAIEVRSYNAAPAGITLNNIDGFSVEQNNVFKDFVTPKPYVNFNVHEISDDITEVLVKKIIPIHKDLVKLFESKLVSVDEKTGTQSFTKSIQFPFRDLYKILSQYELHKDYIEYDTKISLPVKKSIGTGMYVVEKILDDVVDENLDNYITIQLRSDVKGEGYINTLKYKLFDDTIEKVLKEGDQLVTFEGNAKMEIVEVKPSINTIKVKVLYGEYLNLVESDTNIPSNISPLSKICFYSPISFAEDKYIRVPLEEDRFIYVAVAPLNSRMNIQASWGTGVMLDVFNLTNINSIDKELFNVYYKNNVSNIGDILYEISMMMSNTLTKYTTDEYLSIIDVVPEINPSDILVTQINSHIENSSTVKQIRDAYKQKQDYVSKLSQIQKEISTIEGQLSSVSYEDTTGVRASLIESLKSLNTNKNTINSNVNKLLNEIANTAKNAEIPLENAKYRIRGYFNYNSLDVNDDVKKHIKGIRVQYRYKNASRAQGSAMTINGDSKDGGFVFSDWNNMAGFDKERVVDVKDGKYKFSLQNNNDNLNEPSFNQIDIPINQGESVDIRLKVIYDFGAPFVQVSSYWSPIVNIPFPEDFLKNAPILDIIEENNADIEANRFSNMLKEGGITDHISDKLVDQDITFYHKPENISSGYYTTERRVIPLKDKLQELTNAISRLNDEIYGSNGDALKVSFKIVNTNYELTPHQTKNVVTEPYSDFASQKNSNIGGYDVDYNGNLVTVIAHINIKNTSANYSQKLYSIFPGDKTYPLVSNGNMSSELQTKLSNYICPGTNHHIYTYEMNTFNNGSYSPTLQAPRFNQFIYFRYKDMIGNVHYYDGDVKDKDNQLSYNDDQVKYSDNNTSHKSAPKFMFVYPILNSLDDISAPNHVSGTYKVLNPGEEINIPVAIEFKVAEGQSPIKKTISFDILPSLYKDPVTYKVTITSKYINEPGDMGNIAVNTSKQYINTVTQ